MSSLPFTIYTGALGVKRPADPRPLPDPQRGKLTDPEAYEADSDLADAVNVSLHLGQPLLLTGEPGTGKTQLAYSIANELGLNGPLKFETKSTSTAGDLFYTYNSLARFHAAQAARAGGSIGDGREYLTYNALGEAIIQAKRHEDVANLLPPGFFHHGPTRSVVLIDEVDKAPRDFPNDILNEVEGMYFRIPELRGAVVKADALWRPVLVVTSNSEKNLPDPFLRRCVFYNIPFPEPERLAKIVTARLPWVVGRGDDFLAAALDLFKICRLRDNSLKKRPATAELLGWLIALRTAVPNVSTPLRDHHELVLRTMSSLLKNREDQDLARRLVDQWRTGKSPT